MSSDAPRAVFYTRYAINRASSRARAFEYLEPLERLGVPAATISRVDEHGSLRERAFAQVCELARGGAVVVLQKPNLTFDQLDRLLAASKGRLAVDFDDAIWMGYGSGDPADGPASLAATLRSARVLTTGSEHLARWAHKVSGREVKVLPPSVDLQRYPVPRNHEAVPRPVVAWIGSSGNHRDLTVAREALCQLLEEGTVRFRVISDRPLRASQWPGAEWVPWSFQAEVASLSECDIGVMPLVDDERSRGRCGYKAVQYQAAGLPVVASPVGGSASAVCDGLTGIFAQTTTQWRNALFGLATDPTRRAKLGRTGRAHVAARHSIQANLTRLVAVLETARTQPSRTAVR